MRLQHKCLFSEYRKIFDSNYFEEHLWMAASEIPSTLQKLQRDCLFLKVPSNIISYYMSTWLT